MYYGRIDLRESYAVLESNSVWQEAFQWLRAMKSGISAGIYQLRDDDMFVNVHGYTTKPRDACRYESHRRYIDLQYCIAGGEIIEWHPTPDLQPTDAYNVNKDVVHYAAPIVADARLRMSAGSFAVFFPEDGHMPKIASGESNSVEKLVIKIDRKLLS